ncbi:prion-inhibition and propagation-domain-containing protein [Ilyonectria destructans]|nr:prion-inhibition and propagation-domain-containing protein [Ilyonectria destructans]
MDVAGVAIGASALVTLFKTCLDMCDTIECGRRYGEDLEVLTTKVGVERVRLSLWGDTVGLPGLEAEGDSRTAMGVEIDPRLHDPRIVKAVSDILHCIRQLFDDTGSLTRRYGLQPATSAILAHAGSQAAAVGSGGRNAIVTTFKRTYERLQSSALRNQHNSSLATRTRWAVKDQKRFQRFVEDLRSFNNSLSALFPDVDEQALEAMVAEIKSSTDLDGLQIIEQAVMDLDDHEGLVEAASLRITELSQHTTTTDGDGDEDEDGFDAETAAANGDAEDSTIRAANINVSRLARQLEKLDVVLGEDLKGSLQLSISNPYGADYRSFLTWNGMHTDEVFAERDREVEYVEHPYLAWSLMHATETQNKQTDFSEYDSEAGRKFEGKFPGTRTVEGYAAELRAWAHENRPDFEQRNWVAIGDLPRHPIPLLVGWLRDIQVGKAQPWGHTERQAGEDIKKLLGSLTGRPVNGFTYNTPFQVIDLLTTLNRDDIFDDARDTASLVSFGVPGGCGLPNFLFQMILAYELKLRLAQQPGDAFGNMSGRVSAAMQAAERWVNGVCLKIPEGSRETVEMHSLVHEQQVEGLVRFAELLGWPELGEMREFIEDAYDNLRAGTHISMRLWAWLFGAMLPGSGFVVTIMSALIDATPSLKELVGPLYDSSGLVLENQSYWRAKYVLGRVLGGMKGMRAANGWVGPCPRPLGAGRDTERITKGWWRVQARDVSFARHKRFLSHADVDDPGRFSTSVHRAAGDSSQAEWVRTIGDPSKWVVPVGPSKAPDVVEFRALWFKTPGRGEHHTPSKPESQEGGIGPALGTDGRTPWPADLPVPNDEEPWEEPLQRAVLELEVNHAIVSFTLYNNPVFTAAPRCIHGPHPVHERDLPKLQLIRRVSQLSGYIHNDSQVLIIDATGQGECELAARAWCAEYGQHAIVKRGTGTCFACAVRAAGALGLGVGCVIWT